MPSWRGYASIKNEALLFNEKCRDQLSENVGGNASLLVNLPE